MAIEGPIKELNLIDLFQVLSFNQKTGILLLLIPIVAMGVAPLWLSDMIMASLEPFIKGVL